MSIKNVCIAALLLASPVFAIAQTPDSIGLLRLSNHGVEETIAIDESLDQLLHMWYAQQATDESASLMAIEADTLTPLNIADSVYIERLRRLGSYIALPYNQIIKRYINAYTHTKKERVEVMLGLSEYYFPMFEEVLDRYNLPQELRMLPVIESALNPRAVSRAGATGLWQFMYGTGRMYKLTMNTYIDERRDPIRATEVAARFLSDLYKMFQDWTLVIAAYNCGPGNVNKAIRRSGGKRGYWDIYYHLPRETRGYVPAFIAATYAFAYHKEHGLQPRPISMPPATDTVIIRRMLHLQQVSDVVGIPLDVLRDLNPQYKLDVLPGLATPCPLRLPMSRVGQFIDLEDSVYAYKDSIYFNPKTQVAPAHYTSTYQHVVPANSVKYTYIVKAGDVPGSIAMRFGVSVGQLKEWNNIRRNIIRIGQKLTIYVSKEKAKQLGIK
ncbi:MAG: transglycosylase SLT domain-containing protein [Bacteroidales bacterium]|nr:transglycosylase SLT domain-containing protein [Bacteroidales bacterium]